MLTLKLLKQLGKGILITGLKMINIQHSPFRHYKLYQSKHGKDNK
ncbi:MAG: hypothetical protein ACR5KW_03635 [Wolbachia sp.]